MDVWDKNYVFMIKPQRPTVRELYQAINHMEAQYGYPFAMDFISPKLAKIFKYEYESYKSDNGYMGDGGDAEAFGNECYFLTKGKTP